MQYLVLMMVLLLLLQLQVEVVEAAPTFYPLKSASASIPSQLHCCATQCEPAEQRYVGPTDFNKQTRNNAQRNLSTKNSQTQPNSHSTCSSCTKFPQDVEKEHVLGLCPLPRSRERDVEQLKKSLGKHMQ